MKKFTKIVEEVEDKKHFKVSAEIDLVIPADNQGEASYKADRIITSMDNLSEYVINSVEETEMIVESKVEVESEAKLFAEWLRHNCAISSDEGYYYEDETYNVNDIYGIYISKK